MNREIKFRAIDIYTKKFVYGQLVNVSCKKDKSPQTGWRIVQRGIDCLIHTPVDVETVGQFTGLHDKNGKEIYEGDILQKDENSHRVLVYWNEKFLEWSVDLIGTQMNKKYFTTTSLWELAHYEVIGNRFENQDLLGGAA